jgi:hypothetical protein
MGTRKRQENMTPQRVSKHTTKDLTNSEEDENSISELKTMIRGWWSGQKKKPQE